VLGVFRDRGERAEAFAFDTVQKDEWKFIRRRRKRFSKVPYGENADPDNSFGIALSGGGIRSASFCLGALQALHAEGLIKRADYLSTVSGGGYIGAGMVAAMSRHDGTFPYVVDPKSAAAVGTDVQDSEAVSHLRDHSRYLMPGGVSDILLSVAVVARGIAVNFFLILSLILPLAAITIVANPTLEHLRHNVLTDVMNFLHSKFDKIPSAQILEPLMALEPFLLSVLIAIGLLVYLIVWGLIRSLGERLGIPFLPRARDGYPTAVNTLAQRLILLLAATLALELQGPILAWLASETADQKGTDGSVLSYWNTVVTVLSAILLFVTGLRKRLASWIEKGSAEASFLMQFRSVLLKLLLFAVALILPFLVYLGYLTISLWGIAMDRPPLIGNGAADTVFGLGPAFVRSPETTQYLLTATGVLLCWEVLAFSLFPQGRDTIFLFGSRIVARWRGEWAAIAIGGAVILFLAMVLFATRQVPPEAAIRNIDVEYTIVQNYLLATLIVAIMTANFSYNANSLHSLYRDRLNTAFRYSGDPQTDAHGNVKKQRSSLRLEELTEAAPYLLVNAALNARVASDPAAPGQRAAHAGLPPPDPVKRGRNAEFFLFSKYWVGSESTSYVPPDKTARRSKDRIDLASAVAISGAAFSSNMGRANIGVLSPTLALLNVRLGYWMDNPKHAMREIKDLPTHLPWHDFFKAYPFVEAFGLLRTDSSKVYITDGGHIDNLGLYQLLKRRCKYIVVIDAEADPAMNFGALVDVERFARIDLGARISIDFTQIQNAAASRQTPPGETSGKNTAKTTKGLHVPSGDPVHDWHYAVGTIKYDSDKEADGVIVYVKAVVTGDEPDYVLDYERRYPLFPHESTGDQFFSEEQMEAYRALGYHAVSHALEEPKPVDPVAGNGLPAEASVTGRRREAVPEPSPREAALAAARASAKAAREKVTEMKRVLKGPKADLPHG
jgi:hypothetical protein